MSVFDALWFGIGIVIGFAVMTVWFVYRRKHGNYRR
jgi:uncharacterized membrane protein